jgi:SAM-dependent methyltransferase
MPTTELLHPLGKINSVDGLLGLPYFEILACLEGASLHPGGGAATQLLLDFCKLQPTERVLEVGCGPGWTTRALLKANVSVTVVERSQRMLDAMLFHCANEQLQAPRWANENIEDFQGFDGSAGHKTQGAFDLAILECVIGFVNDKSKMVDSIVKQLAVGGRIGVLDVHYVTPPPIATLEAMKTVTGHTILPMSRSDWECLFGQLKLVEFQAFQLPATSHDSGHRVVSASGIERKLTNASPADLARLERYLDEVAAVFAQNKRYLSGHIAVWQLQS